MNIIDFLKKGSGIHIKPENKGKFTKYCKGKVTSECIAKGKRSSDPAVRKRATFAANARKWKHRSGGVIKVQEGGNIWANIGTAAINTINNIKKQKEKNNSIDNQIEGLKKQSAADKKSRWKEQYKQYLNDYLSQNVPDGVHLSSIVAANQAYNNINVEDNPEYNEEIAKLESQKGNIGDSIISGISSIGSSLVSNISSKNNTTTPKNVSPITPQKYDFGNNYSWSVNNGLQYNGIDSWKNSFKFNL